MTVENKKQVKSVVIVVALAVVLSLCVALFFQLRPSADEELTQMKALVSEVTEDDGYMEPLYYEIGDDEASAINTATDQMMSSMSDPVNMSTTVDPVSPGTTEDPTPPAQPATSVNIRDWSQYHSNYSYTRMGLAEQALYDRLTSVAEAYMNSSELDATLLSSKNTYNTYSIRYGDLELSRDQAVGVTQWFLVCNPQYWFLKPTVLSTSSQLYVGIYDIAVDGEARAEITNSLFATVDSWAASAAGATTTYQKVQAVYDKVIAEVSYANGAYDQSAYSSLIQRQSVCAGYAHAMTLVLNSLGVNTISVASPSHAWNYVQMDDGMWYGLDATWGDTLKNYDFFLVSASSLTKLDATGTESHTVDAYAASWCPPVAASDYSASSYDNTGSSSAAATVASPMNLHTEYLTGTSARLLWDSVSGAKGYEVQIYRGDTLVGSTDTTSLSVKLSSLDTTTLTLKVRAYQNMSTGTVYSEWASIPYTHVQGSGLQSNQTTALAGEPGVTLSTPSNVYSSETAETYLRYAWTAVSGADKYEIHVYRDANLTNQAVSAFVTSPSVKLSGLSADTTLYLQVRAVKTVDGNDYYSSWSAATPATTDGHAPALVMAVPTGLGSTPTGESSVRFFWDSVKSAYKYELELYYDAAYTKRAVNSSLSGTGVNFTYLTPATTYYVRIRAVGSSDGTDVFSEWATYHFSTAAAETPKTIAAPANMAADKVSSTSEHVAWDAVENAAKYEVEISYYSDFSKIATTATVTGTSMKLTQLYPVTYYVRVRSVGTINGETVLSDWSNVSFSMK